MQTPIPKDLANQGRNLHIALNRYCRNLPVIQQTYEILSILTQSADLLCELERHAEKNMADATPVALPDAYTGGSIQCQQPDFMAILIEKHGVGASLISLDIQFEESRLYTTPDFERAIPKRELL